MQKIQAIVMSVLIALLVTACGAASNPDAQADRIVADANEAATDIVAESGAPTATEVPPTATPAPTETPTDAPTDVPEETTNTPQPTIAAPTEAPTQAPADSAADGENSRIMALVAEADPENGESLFLSNGCAGCHQPTEQVIVGPGMGGLFEQAADRVEGQGAYEYVFESIRNSQAFIVEGFGAGLMPQFSEAMLSDEDIYDIMAYLETL